MSGGGGEDDGNVDFGVLCEGVSEGGGEEEGGGEVFGDEGDVEGNGDVASATARAAADGSDGADDFGGVVFSALHVEEGEGGGGGACPEFGRVEFEYGGIAEAVSGCGEDGEGVEFASGVGVEGDGGVGIFGGDDDTEFFAEKGGCPEEEGDEEKKVC